MTLCQLTVAFKNETKCQHSSKSICFERHGLTFAVLNDTDTDTDADADAERGRERGLEAVG